MAIVTRAQKADNALLLNTMAAHKTARPFQQDNNPSAQDIGFMRAAYDRLVITGGDRITMGKAWTFLRKQEERLNSLRAQELAYQERRAAAGTLAMAA